MSTTLKVNGQRLWDSLMEIGAIGATPKGGCNRQALTDLDKQARDRYVDWLKAEGCHIRIDEMGNVFARRAGKHNDLPSVMTGSHIDTQPTGGQFDGVYGVLAGVEVIRSLNEQNIETLAPIEACIWTNEEGARFSPAMVASGVWCGEFDLEYGHSRTDKQGKSLGEELERIGYLGTEKCTPHDVKHFIEVHIEQGPILEKEQLQIGIVNGVQGMHWYDLIIGGKPVHAGPTPMNMRQDPFMGLHKIIDKLYQMGQQFSPQSRVTFGDISIKPGSRNTVPQQLILAVDLRHPDQQVLDLMDSLFRQISQETCSELGLSVEIKDEWRSPAVQFDQTCIDAVKNATVDLGYTHKEMFSGAGHDSVYVSRVVPTSMIFIPCKDGISHNEAEYASPEDIEAGCNVLINAMVALANAQ